MRKTLGKLLPQTGHQLIHPPYLFPTDHIVHIFSYSHRFGPQLPFPVLHVHLTRAVLGPLDGSFQLRYPSASLQPPVLETMTPTRLACPARMPWVMMLAGVAESVLAPWRWLWALPYGNLETLTKGRQNGSGGRLGEKLHKSACK